MEALDANQAPLLRLDYGLAIDVSLAQQSGHIGGAPWQTHRGASLSLRAEVERPLRMRGSGGALLERHASLRATGRSRVSLRAAHCIVHDIYRRRCRKSDAILAAATQVSPSKTGQLRPVFFWVSGDGLCVSTKTIRRVLTGPRQRTQRGGNGAGGMNILDFAAGPRGIKDIEQLRRDLRSEVLGLDGQ